MNVSRIKKIDQYIKKTQRFMMIFFSAIVVLLVGIGALMRYLFEADLYGADEFLTIAAFWMYFMGAVYATHTRSHISAEVFSVYCKNETLKRIVHIFQLTITVFLAILYSYWGWDFFYWSLTDGGKSTVWQIPLVVAHTAVVLGFLLMAWYFSIQLIAYIAQIQGIKIPFLQALNEQDDEREQT